MATIKSVQILGSGTSTGVPVLGCSCAICKSKDTRHSRTRASILIHTTDNVPIVVDTGPDFRAQALAAGLTALNHVIYTHTHADHCHGFDDLRAFSFDDRLPVEAHLHEDDLPDLRQRFAYAFEETVYLGSKPRVELRGLREGAFVVAGLGGDLMRVDHGGPKTSALRFGSFAYLTDFKTLTLDQIDRWRGKIDVMVASGIRFRPHRTHSTIPETLALFEALGVQRGFLTHLSHDVDSVRDAGHLPSHVRFAHDGMRIDGSGLVA